MNPTRILQLIRLATDPGASIEEARTSALIACKAMASIPNLERILTGTCPETPSRKKGPRKMASKFPGWCRTCKQGFPAGTPIFYGGPDLIWHQTCPEPEAK